MFGFLNIYKPQGKTSHDVVAILRRITKIKQIGHTGTLDPFAEGVLPVCIGKATRLIEYLDDDKAYIGTIQFGKSTTTYDIEGEQVNVSDKKVTLDEIENVLPQFRGKISQFPPIYSAIKVKGKKLYEYARNGEEVKIEPRMVNAYKKVRSNLRNKLAVVSVKRDACGGCFNKIQPQRQLDIALSKKIIVCEYCGRILISPEFDNE
jgi:tRNA pseudouridine55 synthase